MNFTPWKINMVEPQNGGFLVQCEFSGFHVGDF